MDKLSCMRAFVAVVNGGGFSSAARRSGISKALISKYVAQLEAELDVRLLERTTRRVRTTSIGQAYYERCVPLLEDLDALDAAVRDTHANPEGVLRIDAPTSFAELELIPALSAFKRRYPLIQIELKLTDRIVDLLEEGVDVAIRIARLTDSSLVVAPLTATRIVACAHPDYLAEHGVPQHPEELAHHACVRDDNMDDPDRWPFRDAGAELRVAVQGGIRVNGARAIRELVLGGHGIARCPMFVVADDVRAGRLQIVLERYEDAPIGVYAVYPHRRHLSAKVRLLIDELREQFADRDWG